MAFEGISLLSLREGVQTVTSDDCGDLLTSRQTKDVRLLLD